MTTTVDLPNERLPENPATALPRYAVRTYRLPAKVFHWVTAALVLFMVTTGVTMKQLGSGPVADSLFAIHKTTGILVLTVVLLRILYRLVMPDPGGDREDYRRPILHWLLYAALIAMPLLGWAGISDFGSRGILFGYELPAIWPQGAGYWSILLETHAYLAFGMLALVALHIGVAMQDHMMRARDVAERGEPRH
jgi:cytochrome b561